MKLLMVTPYLPYPPVSGGQTRSYHLITRLAKKHKITLFCYYRHEDERQFVKHLEPFVEKVVLVKRRPVLHPLHIVLGMFSSMPFLLVSTYFSRTLKVQIQRELDSQEYDLIHCETFYVTPNIPSTSIPIILAEQTVEYYVYEHFVHHLPAVLRGLFWLELKKLLHWEKAMWQRAQRILTVSLEDKKAVTMLDPRQKGKLDIVPNGTSVSEFKYLEKKQYHFTQPTIGYVGNFKWLQNTEALSYLLTNVLPKLREVIPNLRILVAGKHIPAQYPKEYPDVFFYESVPNIHHVYNQMDVLVAPLFGPGGTRLKILEAMAAQVLVATTPVGAMGLGVEDGKEVVLFNNEKELIAKLSTLLKDHVKFKAMIRSAYKRVKEAYDWDSIVERLEFNYRLLKKHADSH